MCATSSSSASSSWGASLQTKRKSLPRLAATVKGDHQALHHFLAKATWSEEEVRAIRLRLTREALMGIRFSVVLADSLYGESGEFTAALHRLGVTYVVAIRSHHGVWMFPGQRLRRTRWRPSDRVLTDGSREQRYIRETIFGARSSVRYDQITTDPVTLPPKTTWDRMTNAPGKIERTVGNTFGLRTWIEYGFKQAKDELGWADYRLTDARSMMRWWELVMCAYLLVSLQAPVFAQREDASIPPEPVPTMLHPAWTDDTSWKHRPTNLRLLLQPFICACLLLPWLRVYSLPHLAAGLTDLCALMNTYHPPFPT